MRKQTLHWRVVPCAYLQMNQFILYLFLLLLFFCSPFAATHAHANTASITVLQLVADINGDGDTDDPNETETDDADVSSDLNGNGVVNIFSCGSDIPNQAIKIQIACQDCPDDTTYSYDFSVNDTPLIATNVPIDFGVNTIFVDGTDLMLGNNQILVDLYENNGTSRSIVDTRFFTFEVVTEDVLACNGNVNIGINSACATVITADVLIESTCQNESNTELLDDYKIDLTLMTVSDDFVNSRSIIMPGIINNNTSAVTLQIPGRYRYVVQLADKSCWGFLVVEDKASPFCDPALDVEVPVNWDHDCNPATRNINRPDPSGVDDLQAEYVLCEILEREGVAIFFDELEAEDGFVDYNNNGVQDGNEPSYLGDFQDCSGIRDISHTDEHVEVCTTSDLNNIPIDSDAFDGNRYEICSIHKRTWFAVDYTGRESETGCTQYVFGLRPKKNAVQIDESATVECGVEQGEGLAYPYYQVRPTDILNNGAGSVNRFPINKSYRLSPNQNSCKYAVSYHDDEPISLCGSSSQATERIRHWSVMDNCDGEQIIGDFTQLISISDNTPPTACLAGTNDYLPTDTTLVTQVFNCTATGSIPLLSLKDDCSEADFYEIVLVEETTDGYNGAMLVSDLTNGQDITALGLQQGVYNIIYRFEDSCGNRDEVSIGLTFVDLRAPRAICHDEVNVTLIPTGTAGDQRARVYAQTLDKNSSDNCHPIIREIRLVADTDGEWVDYLEFDCSDATELVEVELRVTGDTNGNGRADAEELSSRCSTLIRLEDKTAPELQVKDGSFFCDDDEFERIILTAGEYDFNSDILFPTPIHSCDTDGVKLRLVSVDTDNYDPVCRIGTITRNFVAFRNSIHGNLFGERVSQTISILFRSDWTIKFPTDILINCDPDIPNQLENIPPPERKDDLITNRACDSWGLDVEDELFDVTGTADADGACFKIIRTYKFINWCTWDPTHTEIGTVPRPISFFTNPDRCVTLDYRSDGVSNICDLQNTIDDRSERQNDSYNLLTANNNNGIVDLISERDADFIYIDERTQIGTDVLGIGDCIDDGFNALANTSIDNTPSTLNYLINDQQEHHFVSAQAHGSFIYRQIIKIVDNEAPVFAPIDDIEICDETGDCSADVVLPVPQVDDCRGQYDLQYSIDLNGDGDTNDGNERRRVIGNPTDGFVAPVLRDVAYGTYRITYTANDNCGNMSQASFHLLVKDCKAPIAYCRGVIMELMPTGMVELWASDIDAGSFDDCSPPVTFSFDAAGMEQARVFQCADLGAQTVQLYVTDAVGNQSICESIVVIQTNELEEECGGLLNPLITGTIANETGEHIEGAMIELSGSSTNDMMTDVSGSFSMNVERGGDYTIAASKNVHPLNGVTTFDLVLMRKHILGIRHLDSPYKMIAADVNLSNSITTLDVVQLRKLILGLRTDFVNNTSWRFVAAQHQFQDATNPWTTPFPELININNIETQEHRADFVAIKIGDLNNSAIPSSLVGTNERNTSGTWQIRVEEQQLHAGQEYEIPFYPKDLAVEGYQFTLHIDPEQATITDIQTGSATMEHIGAAWIETGKLSLSWDGILEDVEQPLFTILLKPKHSVYLSELMQISSEITPAEAYSLNNNTKDISLFFMFGIDIEDIYMLAQNKPNPFTDHTLIQFTLPEATRATLTITDLAGKIVWQRTAFYEAGVQSEAIRLDDLKTSGVFFYHLQAGNFRASRRMVQLAK